MAKKVNPELKATAKSLYVKGWSIPEIARECGINERTLYNWKTDNQWDKYAAPDSVEQAVARRINALTDMPDKTPAQLEELATLIKSFGDLRINLAMADKLQSEAKAIEKGKFIPPEYYQQVNELAGEKPAKQPGKRKPRKRQVKNDISSITREALDDILFSIFFGYQLLWFAIYRTIEWCRNRFILKSRQIGATYYFAFEAFYDAVLTGDNQIFLSASRDQSEVFKAYIIAFAWEHFEIELKGQGVIKLSNGAELRFLSTNSRTAQSYHGHLYVDEVFWIPDFEKLWKVASAMSAHKKWRRTLFSSPSAMSHGAYAMWSGERYNKGRAESKQVEIDISHETLLYGQIGPDKIWRNIINVEDAEKLGCDLFDIDELRDEYSVDDFNNLFMCLFIDDAKSVFALNKLLACMIDTDTWTDYHPGAARPFGNRPVALGYDPSRVRDNATLAILAIPLSVVEKWRVLQHMSFHGQNFQFQANRIRDVVDSHNVKHIGIDITGIGYGVFELVEKFYKRATPINYSLQTKTELVMKGIDVIENNRLEFPAGDKSLTQAFLMITKTTTGSGQITYAANRSNTTGHADVAWSVLHALSYEPIAPRQKTSVAFSD